MSSPHHWHPSDQILVMLFGSGYLPLPMAHLCPTDNTTADASHPRQSRPKAQPTFGQKDASDEENSLPDASLPLVMAYSKQKATSKAVSGKHVGSDTKVKHAPAKKWMKINSGSEGEVVKRSGRAHGAVNWSDNNFTALVNGMAAQACDVKN